MSEKNVDLTTAYLSNYDEYTTFTFRDQTITFLTGKRLEKYKKIIKWEKGYLEVLCKNKGETVLQEDYIDLLPILSNLYIEADSFLTPITEVKLNYV
ncbi:MAG: hypothetical protein SPL86_04960 [Succiniclasticum sp.]|uniref:DUF7724 family protein n=1 Tax=Succiniclasticum sp. TaxID=2775030 RepID=UPI002A9129F8|nr:hypothetical protein [Succiniclasticum sp.]MBR1494067.1 hypothetical protein [Acidaminococcaceae bacterium]MDY6290819.1 hypothetical protein [Succiniclasticum sp.]